jgi:hypothetical protein
MITDQLRELLNAAPFIPFTIHLSDGKSVRIDHPDFVAFSRTGGVLSVSDEGDRFIWVHLRQITRLEGQAAAEV